MLLSVSLLAMMIATAVVSTSTEPPLDCACQMSGEMKFSAAHSKDRSGKWNTQIAVSRGKYNSTDIDTDLINIPDPEPGSAKPEKLPKPSLAELGYEKFEGQGQYKLYTFGETWDVARRRCAQDGAHLAIPNSQTEAAILKEIILRHPTLQGVKTNELAWLGLHDLFNEGQYLTIFGEPVKATGWDVWGPNPDNAGASGVNPGEDCVVFHRNTGKMTDYNCNDNLAFFCEMEEDGKPTSGEIDYSASAYVGIEQEVKPFIGRARRRRPAPGYELVPGIGFYKFYTQSTTWDEARRICRAEGGHLAIINSPEEHYFLQEMFKRHQRLLRNINMNTIIHLGFHDQYNEGHYVTIYGEPLTSTGFYLWYPNEPNDQGVTPPGEDCGVLFINGGFGDAPCNWMLAYICEQELYL